MLSVFLSVGVAVHNMFAQSDLSFEKSDFDWIQRFGVRGAGTEINLAYSSDKGFRYNHEDCVVYSVNKKNIEFR